MAHGRDCRLEACLGPVSLEGEIVDLRCVGLGCRFKVGFGPEGFQGENADLRLEEVAFTKGRHEGNTAKLALASDVGRECRIRVGQRCGERERERVQN